MELQSLMQKLDRRFFRTPAGMALIVVTAGVLVATLFAALQPLPKRHLVMATGPPGSAYALAALQYREIFARNGVKLRLVPTAGAVENIKLLEDRHSGVSVGFSQAGTVDPGAARDLSSLGTVFYEPIWVFCHCPGGRLFQGGGRMRISIGQPGSATRVLALRLLALNGIDARQLDLYAYPPEEAARALLAKDLDAAAILTGWESPVVRSLARAPQLTLVQFPRADAYVALEPSFNKVVMPRGVADLASDRPPEDTTLIASKASLVVRNDVHPALQYLLLHAAMEVHSRAGMFQRAGEFPSPERIDLPISDEARTMYRSGPSFLQRRLPFWLAVLVQRVLILVVPVAGIIYPLWSLVPRLYRWQLERRILHIYNDMIVLERELRTTPNGSGLMGRLDDLDRRVAELRLPMSFSEMRYNLSEHIHRLRWRLSASS
jgi:TRAP-type uncharacterized transport system substrate-binding protein